jgi:NAD+ kinase
VSEERQVLLVTHTGRAEAISAAARLAAGLRAAGIAVRLPDDEFDAVAAATSRDQVGSDSGLIAQTGLDLPANCDLVVVVGGDGTILRAAEYAVPGGLPLLGVNLGHVGFLAEAESDDVPYVVASIVDRSYRVEDRTALSVRVLRANKEIWSTWALNEASLEKAARERMVDVLVEIGGRPLSRWGCDGLIVATPTGSTAYAWSTGGPVVWPVVQAMLVSPISAHALFARPMVVDPSTTVAITVQDDSPEALLWADGRRMIDLLPRDRVEATALPEPVHFARLHESQFTDRLVAKFDLPVSGWRGRGVTG